MSDSSLLDKINNLGFVLRKDSDQPGQLYQVAVHSIGLSLVKTLIRRDGFPGILTTVIGFVTQQLIWYPLTIVSFVCCTLKQNILSIGNVLVSVLI